MPSSDWDAGQALIDRGFCTLDQVREAITIQDRMGKMGIVPKKLGEILLEKGYVTASQLAEAGIEVLQERGYRPTPRPPAARRLRRRRSWVPLFALGGLLAGGALVVFCVVQVVTRPAEPAPPAPPPAAAVEGADKRFEEELAAVTDSEGAAAEFENAEEVVRRYEAFMRKAAGRRWEIEANRRLREYRERCEAFARPALEEIRRREPELREQQRLAELHGLYAKFPAKFRAVTESGRSVREKLDLLGRQMKEAYVREREAAEKLARSGRSEEALAHVKSLELYAAPEQLDEVAGLKVRIEREARARSAQLRRKVADRYLAVDGPFKDALRRRQPLLGAAAVLEFLDAPWTEEERPFVRVAGVDYGALRKAVQAWDAEKVRAICDPAITDEAAPENVSPGEGALLDLRNAALVGLFLRDVQASYEAAVKGREPLELPSLGRGYFLRKDDRTVFVVDGQRVVEGDLNPLREEDLGYLALRRGPTDASTHARVGFFYYYAARGLHEKAYHHLRVAREKGVRGVRIYLADLTAVARGELDRALEAKFGAGEDCFKKRQWVPAKALLDELRSNYGDHPATARHQKEIDRMLLAIDETLRAEKRFSDLYHGKAEPLEGGLLRVTYDFDDKAQAEAFEFVSEEEGRKFKGRWKIERGWMESGYESSVLRWKPRVKGNVTLEYDLTTLEDPQNIATDLYFNKGQGRHYAVVFGFDWVGRSDGDPNNTAEERFGMPRTCVIKYPVLVDKGRWMLQDHWLNWTTRLVGKAAADWKPTKAKAARIRIARQGPKIRVHADQALVWEGEDDAYSEGQILFFTDSRCRIDNLAITISP